MGIYGPNKCLSAWALSSENDDCAQNVQDYTSIIFQGWEGVLQHRLGAATQQIPWADVGYLCNALRPV